MAAFGATSLSKLSTCDTRLVTICKLVIPNYDFTVLEGFRSNERQDELFRQGKSKLEAGKSKHNHLPSFAVDVCPYPIDWDNRRRFYLLAGFMFQAASSIGVTLRWGGDWDGDWDHSDQSFFDLPHFELVM